jgi:hypothetical protein
MRTKKQRKASAIKGWETRRANGWSYPKKEKGLPLPPDYLPAPVILNRIYREHDATPIPTALDLARESFKEELERAAPDTLSHSGRSVGLHEPSMKPAAENESIQHAPYKSYSFILMIGASITFSLFAIWLIYDRNFIAELFNKIWE